MKVFKIVSTLPQNKRPTHSLITGDKNHTGRRRNPKKKNHEINWNRIFWRDETITHTIDHYIIYIKKKVVVQRAEIIVIASIDVVDARSIRQKCNRVEIFFGKVKQSVALGVREFL